MLHLLAEVVAWTLGAAITLGLAALLIRLLRVLYHDSKGDLLLRLVMLAGLAVGAVVLWSAASVTP
jgi:hypothetical protein